jgi:hypothetical protein
MKLFSFPAQVNEYAARTVAATVVTLLVAGFALKLPWVLPLVAIGFVLRVGWGPKFSPLARIASTAAPKIWDVKPVAGPPKRFAQGIGAFCTLTATALWLSGYEAAGWAVAGLVVVFATLEASIAFCMGCWIYARLQGAGIFPPDACIDCAPIKGPQPGNA